MALRQLGLGFGPRSFSAPMLPEEDETSLLGTLGDGLMSGVSIVGNLLDVPGSIARDLVGGVLTGEWDKYNPLDQLLDPLGSSGRVYSRDVLSDIGLMNPNKETGISGWIDDPMEGVRDIASFAGDVVSDPFFFAPKATTSAIKAIGKTGGKIAAAPIPGGIKRAAATAKDKAGLQLNRLFDASVMGRSTPEVQDAARKLYESRHSSTQDVLGETLPIARQLEKAGLSDAASSLRQRDMLEGVIPLDDTTGGLGRIKDLQEAVRQRSAALGLPADELDDVIEYSARRMGDDVRSLFPERGVGRGKRPLSAVDPADVGRDPTYKGFAKGTNAVNQVLTDPEWRQIISRSNRPREAVRQIANRIAQKYGPDIQPLFAKPSGRVVDRYEALAKKIVNNPELTEKGLFTQHWLTDANEKLIAQHHRADTAETIYDLLANPAIQRGQRPIFRQVGQQETTIKNVLESLGLNPQAGATQIAQRQGIALPTDAAQRRAAIRSIQNTVVDERVAKDMLDLWPSWKAPDEVGSIKKGIHSLTSLFKAGVLTWPARYVRDVMSGAIRNWEQGMFSPVDGIDAHKLLQGRTVEGLSKIPEVEQWLRRTGRPVNDANAADAIREIYASRKATPIFQNTDTAMQLPVGSGGIDTLLEQVPGRTPGLSPKEVGKTIVGKAKDTTLNPLDVRGVMRRSGEVRSSTNFGPAVAGEIVGKYTDDVNRLAPLINQMRKGVNSRDAMKKIMEAQVDYSSRAFTKFEQGLKEVFPFYSFSSRQVPYLTKELFNNPGGRLGQMIRAQNMATGNSNSPVPDYIRETASIPIGTEEDGTLKYLSGLGLMHEDPLSFVGGGFRGVLEELGSRLNPIPKAAIEWGMNRSLFRRGQALDELDPTIGRTLVNMGVTDERIDGRAEPLLGSPLLEHVIANSPVSRLASTLRTATDPRKREGDLGALPLVANLLSGVRFTDVSPGTQDAVIRDAANEIAKRDLYAQSFERSFIKNEVIEEARRTDPALAQRMEAYNKLQRALAARAKQRKADQ